VLSNLSSNNLLNPHLSAYIKHHSRETAPLHPWPVDYLINAISSQKISCLCHLDLSWHHWTQHSHHSSWFGIHGSVLNWFMLCVTCHLTLFGLNVKTVSLPPIPAYVVFLKVLFLVLYSSSCIPPLSVLSLILYAVDTQLFFSFYPADNPRYSF